MSRVAKLRNERRAQLIEALSDCETVLRNERRAVALAYRRAFAVVLRAGARYDTSRSLDDPAFDDLSLFGVEPDAVVEAVDDALELAETTLQALREALK